MAQKRADLLQTADAELWKAQAKLGGLNAKSEAAAAELSDRWAAALAGGVPRTALAGAWPAHSGMRAWPAVCMRAGPSRHLAAALGGRG